MLLRTITRLALPPAAFSGVVGITGQGLSAPPAGPAPGVSGYAVTAVHYDVDRGDPARLDGVSFTLVPGSPRLVRVRLGARDGWHSCSVAGGRASCAVSTPLRAVDAIEVSAVA